MAVAWRETLDAVRAQFIPLFAAQKQYEDQLARISAAEEMTAISTAEANSARIRAKASYDALAESLRKVAAPVTVMTGRQSGPQTDMQRQVRVCCQRNDTSTVS